MNIAIGCDHGGYEIKEAVKEYLETQAVYIINGPATIKDYGCYNTDSVDYPDIAHKLCDDIENNTCDIGILVCGSGNGINMTANSHSGVRSALCWRPDIASLARQHNNANVMALPGRFITKQDAINCAIEFIRNEFEGGRHETRVNKIKNV